MSAEKIRATPILYRFVWSVIKGSLSLFFHKIEVRHGQNIPTHGFSFYLFTKRHLIGKMRLARRELIAELDAIKQEYLQIMETIRG